MSLRPRRRPVPTIPIVSLIDILVILLIFFIATTTFREDRSHIKISLPESKTLGETAPEADVRTAITITKEKEILLDGKEIEPQNLAAALTTLRAARPGAKLELEADTDAALGVLVEVWDALRMAGFSINEVPARIERAAAGTGG
ncbi:MAG: biopolymer transporter ExbD [Verrucomicrobiales bacterium]|nr:biopolymer transporter ExbD [Verrucomicrobiales bacterium]